MDSHRGTVRRRPHVKQGKVVSTRYNPVSALRTIEEVLGTEQPISTRFQRPMADVFDVHSSGRWTYTAEASTVLAGTTMAAVENGTSIRFAAGPIIQPQHNAAYWDQVTAGFDFSEADQVPPAQFNRVLWAGLMGGKPYPARSGEGAGARHDQ